MGSTWAVASPPTFTDGDNWKNPDAANNESIKQATSAPEEIHLNPEDLDVIPEDTQDGCDDWTVSRGSDPAGRAIDSNKWTVGSDPA